ncbi:ribbon-helix-helix domain-containing protein [Pseudochelatococcus contaminans]|uniref:Ribbon-helix-helix protein CopG domain-containing protein n=1 Tax=Pseudochelatococcus contaminans TaxID=1538103 RepID=A0A7W5Z2T5_9HYPH|nr:ribbon-helix-helix domain-containing protein [Pseudochelatococcus contaminans]MBB3808764.1 hypothetical protein [Pseudochelatococcus contaminans]
MSEQEKTLLPRKGKRGPAPTGKGQQVVTRLHDDLLSPLDKLIVDSGEALSRPEAIRRALREYLRDKGYLPK